ncbi:hypothetical protein PC114_g19408 [Phytophthora cactorum]|uniref:Transposase n=1 Tax=Phytophthora cactorum TaxID=29920 RepID=A0A8T1D8P2_9STRA|nr:hypothetical protein PC114_g19408 [Phytophthora cactorum]KAG2935989.1 hypothetical protein PC117_g12288 [Phytophthora cactorum]KAG3012821.1 hypothetical protein PC120_g13627 [Phytophthora cactorum]KAG3176379.1 hypothetical protein C6341_g9003 [Phytophthora cactorum]
MGPIRKAYSHDLRFRVFQKWRAKTNEHCKPAPRPGRTPLTDARQDRRIVRAAEANQFVSAAVVAARVTDIGVNVSPEVVRARVRAAGLHGR